MWDFVIKYWMEALFSGLTAFILYSFRRWRASEVKKQDERELEERNHKREIELLKENVRQTQNGIQVMLKDRIYQAYKFHLTQGYCGIKEREIIFDMYKQYKALGGNGIVDDIMHRLVELPTEPCTN